MLMYGKVWLQKQGLMFFMINNLMYSSGVEFYICMLELKSSHGKCGARGKKNILLQNKIWNIMLCAHSYL
jgi:hypothetical protein